MSGWSVWAGRGGRCSRCLGGVGVSISYMRRKQRCAAISAGSFIYPVPVTRYVSERRSSHRIHLIVSTQFRQSKRTKSDLVVVRMA